MRARAEKRREPTDAASTHGWPGFRCGSRLSPERAVVAADREYARLGLLGGLGNDERGLLDDEASCQVERHRLAGQDLKAPERHGLAGRREAERGCVAVASSRKKTCAAGTPPTRHDFSWF